MGQLEKYGLYVLCLLIFLILGVTLWGSPEVAAFADNESAKSANNDLSAGTDRLVVDPPASRAEGGGAVGSIGALIKANPIPKPEEEEKRAEEPATPPQSSPQPGPSDRPDPSGSPVTVERPVHLIRPGDTFEGIALALFRDRRLQDEIRRLNPEADPERLQIGQTIYLPTASEIAQLRGGSAATPPAAAGRTYTIVKGDTLEAIARQQLGSAARVAEIRQLNPGVVDTNLKIGAALKLPAR